ncbi:MAG: hypothetical protein M3N51_00900 [Actinomycetota bacterium]|nr:hypothetical protein [Actinomycetota bacterium]
MRNLWYREEGIGVVTALVVAFIVFTLGGSWYALSIHELEQVSFDRHRTRALHTADGGVREAMYLLGNVQSVRDSATGTNVYTSGITGGVCDLVGLLTSVDGGTETFGEYWLRISDSTPSDPDDHRYFIESWAWAPRHDARQASAKKVEQEVTLIPRWGFTFGLFGASAGLNAGNRKEIHGDVYSGQDVTFANETLLLDNGSFPGDGNLEVYGNLNVTSGAATFVEGTTTVNGYINDQHADDRFLGDVTQVIDGPGLDAQGHDAYFKKAAFGGVLRLGGTLEPTSVLQPYSGTDPVLYTENATGLEPVPSRPLPAFTWNAADYDPPVQTYLEWVDFLAYYSLNIGALKGAHYVQDPLMDTTADPWDLKNAKFADDFVLVVDGKLATKGNAALASGAPTPLTVALIGNQTSSKITLGQNFFSDNSLRYLVYSKGQFASEQSTTVYGAVYAKEDVSSQKLTIYYRPPTNDVLGGFTFSETRADVQLGVWREVPPQGLPCTLP